MENWRVWCERTSTRVGNCNTSNETLMVNCGRWSVRIILYCSEVKVHHSCRVVSQETKWSLLLCYAVLNFTASGTIAATCFYLSVSLDKSVKSVKNAMQMKNTANYILYYMTFSFFLCTY
jgi:hypothetical protein